MTGKEQFKEDLRFRLVAYANKLGYGVDFESMEGEGTPAGICLTGATVKMICIRKGKKISGVITSLVHEIVHAHNVRDGQFYVGDGGKALEEWECESVAHFVTQLVGIDRRKKTEAHVAGYIGLPVFNTNERVTDLTHKIYSYLIQ